MNNNFIKNIKIHRYKCFENFEANGFKRVNLIGGRNNIGKTAFMEACYLGLSTINENSFYQALIVLELSRNPLEELKIIEDSNNFNFKFKNTNILINNEIKNFIPNNLFKNNDLYVIPKKNYNIGIEEITQFYSGKNKPLNIKNKTFISMNNIRAEFIAECIDEIKLQDNEDKLNSILSELFDIKKIDVIKRQVMIKKDKEFMLLNEFGDGVKHLLNIILALYLNENNTIYLDEIDNGIHYSLFDKLWGIIFKISKIHNVQVFATTHSKECINSYYKVSKKMEENDVSFINLSKNKQNEIIAIVLDTEMLYSEIEQNHELRAW
jgi:AAA15 family ATPase/GTPase